MFVRIVFCVVHHVSVMGRSSLSIACCFEPFMHRIVVLIMVSYLLIEYHAEDTCAQSFVLSFGLLHVFPFIISHFLLEKSVELQDQAKTFTSLKARLLSNPL